MALSNLGFFPIRSVTVGSFSNDERDFIELSLSQRRPIPQGRLACSLRTHRRTNRRRECRRGISSIRRRLSEGESATTQYAPPGRPRLGTFIPTERSRGVGASGAICDPRSQTLEKTTVLDRGREKEKMFPDALTKARIYPTHSLTAAKLRKYFSIVASASRARQI